MNRIKLILAALAVSLLSVAGVSLAGVAPAQAAFGGTCATDSFCLYQWKGLDGPTAGARWQSSYANFLGHSDNCINLYPDAHWANGDPVYDNSASAMFKTGTSGQWGEYYINVYNWTNCNTLGQFGSLDYLGNNTFVDYNDLSTRIYQQPSGTTMSEYHTITSIKLQCSLGDGNC